jgi:soluble lytic murein transglycosylase-like protein
MAGQALPVDADGNAMPAPTPAAQPAPAQPQPQAAAQPTAQPPAPAGPVTPVASSEPARAEAQNVNAGPGTARPPIDPRPYGVLAQNHPDVKTVVDGAAQQFNVAPETIAAHMKYENNFRMADAPDSKTGAMGPMQIEPGTAAEINKNFGTNLDPRKPDENVALGAGYIRMMEDKYGVGTPASTLAYVAGPGNADKIAADPSLAAKFPDSMKYVNNVHGTPVDPTSLSGSTNSNMTPRGLVLAGTHGGPMGALSYIAQSKPQDMTMSDAWQHAEAMMVGNFVRRGDMTGASHARDFVFNMSHQGSQMALQGAYNAASAGDGVSTAKFLAQAHAFFPDGGMGQFGVDSKGQVWGQNMDEQNPTKPLGQPFQVTPQAIAGMLNQTTDPRQFLETLQKQQSSNAQARMFDQHGTYYAGLNQSRENVALINAGARTDSAEIRSKGQTDAADIRAGVNTQHNNVVNKEVETNYGSDAMPTASAGDRMQLAQMHTDMRKNGADSVTANVAALGLQKGAYQTKLMSDGNYAVVDPKNPNVPIATMSASAVTHLAGAKGIAQGGPPKSAIGSNAGGVQPMTSNLSGSAPNAPQPQQALPTPGQ